MTGKTYQRRVYEGVLKVTVPCQQLAMQESGILHITVEGDVNAVRGGDVVEDYGFEGHGVRQDG